MQRLEGQFDKQRGLV